MGPLKGLQCNQRSRELIAMTSEKLCLKWNDFQENVNKSFLSLKEDNEFTDVTLACEDDQQVEAHEAILAASSPFFEHILKKNRHPHPLIYMKGTKIDDLLAILDFLYCGEANVFQENLDSFLAIAEELKLNGLTAQQDLDEENIKPKEKGMKPKLTCKRETLNPVAGSTIFSQPILMREKIIYNPEEINVASHKDLVNSGFSQQRALSVQDFGPDHKLELDAKVKSLMEKSGNKASDGKMAFICQICGKEGQRFNIRKHIETKHFDRV